MCVHSARHPLLPSPLTFSAIVLLVSFYLGSSDFLQPRNKDSAPFSGFFWSPQLIGSGVNQASRARTLKWDRFAAECLGAPVCVSNTIRPARCSVANENASNQGVLQGSHPCWCFIVSLSLTSQAGLGMQPGQFLISGGIGAACVRHWVGDVTPAVPSLHREPPFSLINNAFSL